MKSSRKLKKVHITDLQDYLSLCTRREIMLQVFNVNVVLKCRVEFTCILLSVKVQDIEVKRTTDTVRIIDTTQFCQTDFYF